MKKLITLILVAATFVSCSSDDDNENSVAVEGTWKMTSLKSQDAYDLNGDGTLSNDIIGQTNCYQNETIIFNSNQTGTDISRTHLDIDLQLVAGTTNEYMYITECISENNTTSFTWTNSMNTVTVSKTGSVFTGILNGNEITFTKHNGFTIEVQQGNGTAFISQDLTAVYQKQ